MKKNLTITLTTEIMKKLSVDTNRLGFPSKSFYISELIKKGLPVSDSLDIRLQLIEKKIDMLSKDTTYSSNKILSIIQSIFKRVYIVYRIGSFLLARSFFIKPGRISDDDVSSSNSFIEQELKLFEKKYEVK